MVKSKTKQVLCINVVLYTVFICIKNLKHLNDFLSKSIPKENERLCCHKTYFSTREVFCVFILVLVALLNLKILECICGL